MLARPMAIWKLTCTAAALLLALSLSAAAQSARDLVEQALDQPIAQLIITDQPLTAAFEELEKKTGLSFVLDPATADLLPYGPQTRVTIEIRNLPARAALHTVFEGLGLEMQVERDKIILRPGPVLNRLGRRITVEEVGVLRKLTQLEWGKSADGWPPLEFHLDPSAEPATAWSKALLQVPGANALHQFESGAQILGWTWRPDGARVIIESRRDSFRRRLELPQDISFSRAPLDGVLSDLSARCRVPMVFDPGILRRIDARDLKVDLAQRDVSTLQLLERICGNTGLRFEIQDDGVHFAAPAPAASNDPARASEASRTGEIPRSSESPRLSEAPWTRVSIQVEPGLHVDVLVRLDQLRPDVREKVEKRLNEVLLGPRPTSQPAP